MILAVTLEFVAQTASDALAFGSLYALFALGIALIFGIMQLINFAHGELIMLGGYTLALLSGRLPTAAVIVAALAGVILVALVMERAAFRPLREANPASLLVASFIVSFMLQNLIVVLLSSVPRSVNLFGSLTQALNIGEISIPRLNLVIVAVTFVLLGVLRLFLARTTLGVRMRAAAEDFEMTRLLGLRANSIIATAFAASGLLAAVAAVLLVAQSGTVSPTMGLTPVIFAFIATIIGGIGSLSGAVLGGFVVGAVTVALQASLPLNLRSFRDAFVFAILIGVLVLRPQGLIVAPATRARV